MPHFDWRLAVVERELLRIELEWGRGPVSGISFDGRRAAERRLRANAHAILDAIDVASAVNRASSTPPPPRQMTTDELWDTIVAVAKP